MGPAREGDVLASPNRDSQSFAASQPPEMVAIFEQMVRDAEVTLREGLEREHDEHLRRELTLQRTRCGTAGEYSMVSSGNLPSTSASDLSFSAPMDPASLADLRSEIADLRGSLQMHAHAAEGALECALESLRNELPSHGDIRAMREQLDRSNAEFARGIEDVVSLLDASTGALRAEFRFATEHRQAGGELQGRIKAGGRDTPAPRLELGVESCETANRQRSELLSLRASLQELGSRLDNNSQNIVALGRDFAELQEHSSAIARSTQKAIDSLREEVAAKRSDVRLSTISESIIEAGEAEKARSNGKNVLSRALELDASEKRVSGFNTDLDEVRDSVRRFAEDIDIRRRTDEFSDVAKKATDEPAKYASPQVSPLGDGLHMTLQNHMKGVVEELRGDLQEQVACLARHADEGSFRALSERVPKLEDSELDLRLGMLETRAHIGAARSAPAVQTASAEQALTDELDVSCRAAVPSSAADVLPSFEEDTGAATKLREVAAACRQQRIGTGTLPLQAPSGSLRTSTRLPPAPAVVAVQAVNASEMRKCTLPAHGIASEGTLPVRLAVARRASGAASASKPTAVLTPQTPSAPPGLLPQSSPVQLRQEMPWRRSPNQIKMANSWLSRLSR